MSSAKRADLEAMMADLGNSRLEQLATDGASRGRQGLAVNRQPHSTQPAGHPSMKSTSNLAENAGAARWTKAVNEGLFNDDDYRGVKNLDSIDDGNAHRRHREPRHGSTYDPANPLGPRGNPSRSYSSAGQTSRFSGLPTPGITHGVGRGAPAPARGVTRQPLSLAGRGYGASPSIQNPPLAAAGHGRGRGRASTPVLSTPQGLTGTRPVIATATAPRVPSAVASQHGGGAGATSELNIVPPSSVEKESPISKVHAHENGVAKKADQPVDATSIPPHLRHRHTSPRQKVEPAPLTPEEKNQGQAVSKGVVEAIAAPSDHSQIVYRDDKTDTSLIVGKERAGVRSTVTLYVQPKIDTVFWEVSTKSLVLRGDIRACIAPLVVGDLLYLRRQEKNTAGVQNCYITFSSSSAAEKFKTALNFHRDKYANSTGEIFKETSENPDKVEERSVKKTPLALESPKTEMSGQTAVEDLIDLNNVASPEKLSSRPDDLQEPREHSREAPVHPIGNHCEPSGPRSTPTTTYLSGGSALPVIANIAKHDNKDAKCEGNYEECYIEDSRYDILGHSVETVAKIPAGTHLSRESLRVLANITNKDYHSMNRDYLSKVRDFRTMLPSNSTMPSHLIITRLKRMALNVAARWLWMDPSFSSLRFNEQKQVCAVVYTNVNHGRKRIIRPIAQLTELRPSLTLCPREVVEFNEFLRMDGLDKKYNPGPSSINWDRDAEDVAGYLSGNEEVEKNRKEEETRRAEAEKKRVEQKRVEEKKKEKQEEQRKQEELKKQEAAMKSASSLTHNRTLNFLLDNELSSDDDTTSSRTNSQRVPVPPASSGNPEPSTRRTANSPASTQLTGTLPEPNKSSTDHPHDNGLNRASSSSHVSCGSSHVASGRSIRNNY
ncbi:uncharacterized protein F4807DRAFT_464961 [Annulohypoxylon truncatum]|uniref:uncharacterized protein n=1 Tax=Annulohypoxylon truncatum TaxID=327061 RepID=UPI0020079ED3|nr:uncharacterized protein F4807DRAFT_464961 [Annulohypoxylon truncatum]KAI1205142.1 hypothetical protein F4807DRAFT_464961 [Annulohypoxylon truncatum]